MAGRSTFGTVIAKARPLYLLSLRLPESGAVLPSSKRLTQPPLIRSIPIWFCRLCLDSTDHRRIPQPDQSRSVRGRYRTYKYRQMDRISSAMQPNSLVEYNFSPALTPTSLQLSVGLPSGRRSCSKNRERYFRGYSRLNAAASTAGSNCVGADCEGILVVCATDVMANT